MSTGSVWIVGTMSAYMGSVFTVGDGDKRLGGERVPALMTPCG